MPNDAFAARCVDVTRTFRTGTSVVQALRGVTASFPSGRVAAVAGPSGSGKSSLLRLLAGMDLPSSGSVVVTDRSIGRASAGVRRRLRRERVGYVFQRPSDNFVPHLTVGEHLARSTEPAEVDAILEAFGIAERRDHLPHQLSGGEQQRAAFAQVLASGARLVVADEPTAELDDASAATVLAAIRALRDRGVTLILATHDPAVVLVADTRLTLDHGVVADPPRTTASRWAPPDARAVRPDARAVRPDAPTDASADGELVLRIRDLTKTFHRAGELVHAVDGVSLEVHEGELVGLVGRSGSGKTTLLGLIAAWEHADRGAIDREERASDGPPGWRDVAVVPQTLGLMDELTVRENVAYAAKLEGSLEGHSERLTTLLEALGLSPLAERRPSETSIGEQQRAAVARALLLGPRLLVADEPTCHQDRGWTDRVFAALRDACDAGMACIMATHDETARRFFDRSFVMHDGRIEPTAR